MASNDILDAELRREVNRDRFATGLTRTEVSPTTQELSRSLPRIMSDFDFEDMTTGELNELTVLIRKEFGSTWSTMWDDITAELRKLARIEGEAVTGVYQDFTPDPVIAPSAKQVDAATRTAVMTLTTDVTQSGTWAQFVRRNLDTTTQRVTGVIREGFNNGLTRQQVVQQLRGKFNRKTRMFEGGILNGRAKAGANALTRTGTSHFANVARDEFAVKNKALIEGRVLFATLDNRTTTICFRRHLMFYATGERFPPLPFHFGERSQYIFKTKGFDPLNTDRAVVSGKQGKEAREKFETRQQRQDNLRDNRAERRADGQVGVPTTGTKVRHRGRKDTDIFDVQQVSAKLTSDAWLRRQPRWFVESSLGKTRANLFLSGDLHIDRFTDITGRQLTLDELKQTNAGDRAFRKAEL